MRKDSANRMSRQQFLKIAAGGAIGAALPSVARAQSPGPTTCLYKTVGGCQIRADVYPSARGAPKPAVMWIHGGALIMGSRKWPDAGFFAALRQRGFVIVSIDYRLAPETKLPGIIEDVQDAWRWMRQEGPKRFGIDPEGMATAGGSAGGYLTLMTGFCLEPRPRVLISYYGYGDITTPWFSKPDAFYRRRQLVSKEEAYRSVGRRELSEPPTPDQREQFYLYCRQQGAWPNEVAGHDPHGEPKWFDAYCPIRNVTAAYPPTLLIHGTADTDVPYSESKNMADKLAESSVTHELITVTGAGHGLSGAKPDKVAQIAQQAAEYIKSHTS
jgi:acetyl esterase/lipase